MTRPDTPTAVLRDEHRLILRVADALEEILVRGADEGLDHAAVAECITFFRQFAGACHHGKEEDILFPELERRGLPRHRGPIAVMLYEHRQGRAFIKQMADALPAARAGNERSGHILRNASRGYIDLIRSHILKEDRVLFDMADGMIPDPACRELCGAYERVCARKFRSRTKAQLEELAADITERFALAE
ncbi:MAG: hemerythrin domain-containing protein [Gemmatimonadota bacterium]